MPDALLGILAMVAVLAGFVGVMYLGFWIDGRRQALREQCLHPVTNPDGQVEARELEAGEHEHGS